MSSGDSVFNIEYSVITCSEALPVYRLSLRILQWLVGSELLSTVLYLVSYKLKWQLFWVSQKSASSLKLNSLFKLWWLAISRCLPPRPSAPFKRHYLTLALS